MKITNNISIAIILFLCSLSVIFAEDSSDFEGIPFIESNSNYIKRNDAPQTMLVLQVNGRLYPNPSEEFLANLYGPEYKNSVYWRTKQELAKDSELTRHIKKLQSTRNNDVRYVVEFDDPKKLQIGETFQHFDEKNGKWKSVTVQKNDSVETIAQKLGITADELVSNHKERFEKGSRANHYDSTVHLSESERDDDDGLRGLIAHETAHTIENGAPPNYGKDGNHYFNEVTDPATAWVEGWAEYNQGIFDPKSRTYCAEAANNLEMETQFSSRDMPVLAQLKDPDFGIRLANEGTVATILSVIDDNGRNRQRILDTVESSNKSELFDSSKINTFENFATSYIERNPEQLQQTLLAIDASTNFKATDNDLINISGKADATQYLNGRESIIEKYKAFRKENPEGTALDFLEKYKGNEGSDKGDVSEEESDINGQNIVVEAPKEAGGEAASDTVDGEFDLPEVDEEDDEEGGSGGGSGGSGGGCESKPEDEPEEE